MMIVKDLSRNKIDKKNASHFPALSIFNIFYSFSIRSGIID